MLTAVAECLHVKLKRQQKSEQRPDENKEKRKFQVMPYLHKVSHNLKKIASRHGVRLVFSAPCKLSGLCTRIENAGKKRGACKTKHEKQFVKCDERVIYNIPLTCGKVYIGQTGRCINDRLREHCALIRGQGAGHLSYHCRQCKRQGKCEALFERVTILGRGRTKTEREIIESLYISQQEEGNCGSVSSISLSDKEIAFLQS